MTTSELCKSVEEELGFSHLSELFVAEGIDGLILEAVCYGTYNAETMEAFLLSDLKMDSKVDRVRMLRWIKNKME